MEIAQIREFRAGGEFAGGIDGRANFIADFAAFDFEIDILAFVDATRPAPGSTRVIVAKDCA